MKKSQKINSCKLSNTDWKIFKSKTRIFTYFAIISAFWILWCFKMNSFKINIFLLYLFAFIWQIFWQRKRKKIFLQFNDKALKVCNENKEITELEYWDIKEVVFLKHKLLHMLWFLLLALLCSILLIFLSQSGENVELLWLAIVLPLIYFIFHTLPILIFRKNCRSISIITKDKTIKLPKIKWEKELKQILDEKKVRYSCWWSII